MSETPERRRIGYQELERRINTVENAVRALQSQLDLNTKLTVSIADDTSELRAIFAEARGAFRLFRRVMAVIKAVALPLAILCAALILWKTGKLPAWYTEVVK